MINKILGKKIKQTQIYLDDGSRQPVTYIIAGPCFVTQITQNGNRKFIQIGFGSIKNISKPETGHLKKAGLTQKLRFLRSFEVSDIDAAIKPGTELKLNEIFNPGDKVNVSGISKGKGFAGVVKRHHFKGGPRTHGQSDRERSPGSIGQTTTPGRVYKGKRMAGRMGGANVTVKSLRVISVNPETNTLVVKGLVPGHVSSVVEITKQ